MSLGSAFRKGALGIAAATTLMSVNAFADTLQSDIEQLKETTFVQNVVDDIRDAHGFEGGQSLRDAVLEACTPEVRVFPKEGSPDVEHVTCRNPFSPSNLSTITYGQRETLVIDAIQDHVEQMYMNGDIGFWDMMSEKAHQDATSFAGLNTHTNVDTSVHPHVRPTSAISHQRMILPNGAEFGEYSDPVTEFQRDNIQDQPGALENYQKHYDSTYKEMAKVNWHETSHWLLQGLTETKKIFDNVSMSQRAILGENLAMTTDTLYSIKVDLEEKGLLDDIKSKDSITKNDPEIDSITPYIDKLITGQFEGKLIPLNKEIDMSKEDRAFTHLSAPLGYYLGKNIINEPDTLKFADDVVANSIYSLNLMYSIMEERGLANELGAIDFDNIKDSVLSTKLDFSNQFNQEIYGIDSVILARSLRVAESDSPLIDLLVSNGEPNEISEVLRSKQIPESTLRYVEMERENGTDEAEIQRILRKGGYNFDPISDDAINKIFDENQDAVTPEFSQKVFDRTVATLDAIGFDLSKIDIEITKDIPENIQDQKTVAINTSDMEILNRIFEAPANRTTGEPENDRNLAAERFTKLQELEQDRERGMSFER